MQSSFQSTGHDEFSADVAVIDDSGVGVDLSLQFKPDDSPNVGRILQGMGLQGSLQ